MPVSLTVMFPTDCATHTHIVFSFGLGAILSSVRGLFLTLSRAYFWPCVQDLFLALCSLHAVLEGPHVVPGIDLLQLHAKQAS